MHGKHLNSCPIHLVPEMRHLYKDFFDTLSKLDICPWFTISKIIVLTWYIKYISNYFGHHTKLGKILREFVHGLLAK